MTLLLAAAIVLLYVLVFFNPGTGTALNSPFSIPVDWALRVAGDRPIVAYVVAVLAAASGLWWATS